MIIILMKIKIKRVIRILNVIVILTHNNIIIFVRLRDKNKLLNKWNFFLIVLKKFLRDLILMRTF